MHPARAPETRYRSAHASPLVCFRRGDPRDIATLASDGFEGHAPGTRGEDSSVAFLQREFMRIGLKPGNHDGTYIQRVPLP